MTLALSNTGDVSIAVMPCEKARLMTSAGSSDLRYRSSLYCPPLRYTNQLFQSAIKTCILTKTPPPRMIGGSFVTSFVPAAIIRGHCESDTKRSHDRSTWGAAISRRSSEHSVEPPTTAYCIFAADSRPLRERVHSTSSEPQPD